MEDNNDWRTERAVEIFEGILNGDTPVYDNVDLGDILDKIDIDGDETYYEIETHINKLFLSNGYEWESDDDGEMMLIKKK